MIIGISFLSTLIINASFIDAFSLHVIPARSNLLSQQQQYRKAPPIGRVLGELGVRTSSRGLGAGVRDDRYEQQLTEFSKHLLSRGKPSSPGWKNRKLDELTEWATSDEPNRPIVCEYEPDALWLWTKWRGTALAITFVPVITNVVIGIAVDRVVHCHSDQTWAFLAVPPADDPLVLQLVGLKSLWEYQLTLCTFILAFFTQEAYKHWKSVYFTTRAIQGRINDVCMILTMSAKRNNRVGDRDGVMTGYDQDAKELVSTCTRLIRLSHTFFWATTQTYSNGVGDGGVPDGDHVTDYSQDEQDLDAIGPLLLSPYGLRFLERADELTHEEVESLLACELPPSQYPYILLEWVGMYALGGLHDGTLVGGPGVEDQLMKRLTDIRAEYFSIGDFAAGRMPLAYVQLLQVLVDSLVWLSPFSLYSGLGSLSIPLCALLTLFFKGLLELSKSFLDPFGNEGFPGQNIRVDVLVSELNFGAASRWYQAGDHLPVRNSTSEAK